MKYAIILYSVSVQLHRYIHGISVQREACTVHKKIWRDKTLVKWGNLN